ncbi:MAG: hypothetical protein V4515_15165 [Chloroflexota bacterium]
MAYTRTFAQLSLAVQQLGGWEGSSDITPAVLLQAINYGLIEGYRAMVNAWKDYYTLQADFAIVAGTDTYALATIAPNFFELRHVSVSSDGVRFIPCPPHDLSAADRWSGVPSTTVGRLRRRMQAGNLVFVPKPPAAFGRIYYIPLAPQFASTVDATALTFDVPSEELLVVAYAYRETLFRSELDPSPGDKKIAEGIAGLRTDAGNRDAESAFFLDPAGPRRERVFGGDVDEWF